LQRTTALEQFVAAQPLLAFFGRAKPRLADRHLLAVHHAVAVFLSPAVRAASFVLLMPLAGQVPDFLVLAIAASFLHLGAAYVIGFVNEVGHSKKHAVGKVSWLLILTGMFVLIIVRAARWPGMGRTIWNGPLGWFPRGSSAAGGISLFESLGFDPAANPVPDVAVFMLIGGLVLLLATESGLAIMEVFGLLANMISYARLAAVGVAKAAMAFAFNVIALEVGFFPWLDSGDVVALVLGVVVLVLFHLIIFLLGAVSAAIQSIRLNYVEFFIKFFKGSGTLFRPFGIRQQPEV